MKKQKEMKNEKIEQVEFNSLQGKIVVGVDPGKHNIMYVYMTTDDNCKTKSESMKYTSQQRAFESGTFKFKNKLQNRKPNDIEELEHKMCSVNSQTGHLD